MNNKDIDNLRFYFQYAGDELRFYKKLIMSLTNYVFLLNGALIYLYSKYNISSSYVIFSSYLLCVLSFIFIYFVNCTMEDMREAHRKIAKLIGGHFEVIASENNVMRSKNIIINKLLKCMGREYFIFLYYSLHFALPIIMCIIVSCADKSYLSIDI